MRDQTIFFVLSRDAQHNQMIFGYMKIRKVVHHRAAYRLLPGKRMSDSIPNGNIIVNGVGRYSRWDYGIHQHNFEKIARKYAIGYDAGSRFLTAEQIESKAPEFTRVLGEILGTSGNRPIDHISRFGRRNLSQDQVDQLKAWVEEDLPAYVGEPVSLSRPKPGGRGTICAPAPKKLPACGPRPACSSKPSRRLCSLPATG